MTRRARTDKESSEVGVVLGRYGRAGAAMDRELRTVDITPTQFYALAHIARAPGLSGAELARGLLTTPQAVATLVTRLLAAGLVEREQPGRSLAGAVRLTPAGHARLTAATTVAVAAEAGALSSVPAADQRRFTTVLQSLLDALELAPSPTGPRRRRTAPAADS